MESIKRTCLQMKYKLKQNNELLTSLVGNKTPVSSDSMEVEDLETLKFPLESLEQLERFEEELKQEATRKKLVSII